MVANAVGSEHLTRVNISVITLTLWGRTTPFLPSSQMQKLKHRLARHHRAGKRQN